MEPSVDDPSAPSSRARTTRKRQRESTHSIADIDTANYPQLEILSRSVVDIFLPTHLSLLRTLHTNDQTTGTDSSDFCPHRPPWWEVNRFMQLQASMIKRQSHLDRTHGVLRALGCPSTVERTPASPPTSCPFHDTISGHPPPVLQQRAGHPVSPRHVAGTAVRDLSNAGITLANRALGDSSEGHVSTISSNTIIAGKVGSIMNGVAANRDGLQIETPLDPKSVVCATLRRAMKGHREDHRSACMGLQGLRRGVDDTVDMLASSLNDSLHNRKNRGTPWGAGEGGGRMALQLADADERHTTKLMLWRKLQSAMSAHGVIGGHNGRGKGLYEGNDAAAAPSCGQKRNEV